MTDATIEQKPEKQFDAEAFAMNIARAMESGGKALANEPGIRTAYLGI